jgi:hypothetical protein
VRQLIGLGGVATSGKDAVADFLVADHDYGKTYFSKPLEEALLILNPIVEARPGWGRTQKHSSVVTVELVRYRELHAEVGYEKSKENPEVRGLLQRLGTEVGREMFGQNVWVDIAERNIRDIWGQGKDAVITGVRFPNELERISRLGGTLVWVDRGLPPVNTHASDNTIGVEDFDKVLDNTGTLDDLRKTVAEMELFEWGAK